MALTHFTTNLKTLGSTEFTKDYTKTFDKTTTKYEHFLILGDLNYDMLVNEKCTALKEVCDIFDIFKTSKAF
jgi:hypothetical protein